MTTRTQAYGVDIADVEYLNHSGSPLLARLFKPQGTGPVSYTHLTLPTILLV